MTKEEARETAKLLIEAHDVGPKLAEILAVLADLPAKTLRGWVMTKDPFLESSTVMMALESGLTFWPDSDYMAAYPWSVVEKEGWTVRALTPSDIGYRVRKWDEWTDEEQERVIKLWQENNYPDPDFFKPLANLAIDIATKQEDV